MSKKFRMMFSLSMALLCVGAFAAATSTSAGTPGPSDRGGCGVGNGRGFGKNMYLTALSTRRVSCRTGRQVVNQYSSCRYSHGHLNGRCGHRVKRFSCREGRRTVAPGIQYSTNVTCRRGRARVIFSYTQQI